ncbi:MAG TPA: DUF3263 domain-containing protein [Actinomycetota bacterium]|nr:DUF3263 domain-containing protein [Actinomycetota bacterium]
MTLDAARPVPGTPPDPGDPAPPEPGDWRAVIDFERSWWRDPGPKEPAIRERFGLSPARYHQLLDRALDRPEALRYDPMLVRRLRRLREARRRKRFAPRLAP